MIKELEELKNKIYDRVLNIIDLIEPLHKDNPDFPKNRDSISIMWEDINQQSPITLIWGVYSGRDYDDYIFQLNSDYLNMDDEKVFQLEKEEVEAEKLRQERLKAEEERKKAEAREQRDISEYERLKKKFGG